MIIIEGADSLGKTTFIDALEKLMPKLSRDKCGLPEANYIGAEPWKFRYKRNCIMDRFVLSEPIYGITCRGKSNITAKTFNKLMHGLVNDGPIILVIFTTESLNDYREIMNLNYDSEREAFSKEQCIKVNEVYRQFANTGRWKQYCLPSSLHTIVHTVPVVWHDYHLTTLIDLAADIANEYSLQLLETYPLIKG